MPSKGRGTTGTPRRAQSALRPRHPSRERSARRESRAPSARRCRRARRRTAWAWRASASPDADRRRSRAARRARGARPDRPRTLRVPCSTSARPRRARAPPVAGTRTAARADQVDGELLFAEERAQRPACLEASDAAAGSGNPWSVVRWHHPIVGHPVPRRIRVAPAISCGSSARPGGAARAESRGQRPGRRHWLPSASPCTCRPTAGRPAARARNCMRRVTTILAPALPVAPATTVMVPPASTRRMRLPPVSAMKQVTPSEAATSRGA